MGWKKKGAATDGGQDIEIVRQEESGSNPTTAVPEIPRHRAARMGGKDHLADG